MTLQVLAARLKPTKAFCKYLQDAFCYQSQPRKSRFVSKALCLQVFQPKCSVSVATSNGQAKIMAEVLLVDDDDSVLLTLALALRRRGHEVTVASDAQQALAQLHRRSFDFLISDVRMPGMSGLELATRVQRMAHPPRVILTSAYPFIEQRAGVSEAFLSKPLDVQQLNEHLNSSL